MLTKEQYLKIKNYFSSGKPQMYTLKFVYKILPIFVFISYPLLLGYLYLKGDGRLIRSITVPLGVFVTVTIIRKFINCQRPYEKFDIQPLIPKDTKGKSFPSRHTASAAVIGMTFLYINVPLGIVFLIISVLIGLSRICGGVHFPRDTAAGFLYAVIMSAVMFYLF